MSEPVPVLGSRGLSRTGGRLLGWVPPGDPRRWRRDVLITRSTG